MGRAVNSLPRWRICHCQGRLQLVTVPNQQAGCKHHHPVKGLLTVVLNSESMEMPKYSIQHFQFAKVDAEQDRCSQVCSRAPLSVVLLHEDLSLVGRHTSYTKRGPSSFGTLTSVAEQDQAQDARRHGSRACLIVRYREPQSYEDPTIQFHALFDFQKMPSSRSSWL